MAKSDSKEDTKMDMAQDKKIIKKAFSMHDKQEHKGQKTNLDALKKGGNVKKMAMGGPTGLGQMVQNKSENFNRGNRMANFQNRPNSKMPFGQGQNSSQLGQLAQAMPQGGLNSMQQQPTSGFVTNVSPTGPATAPVGGLGTAALGLPPGGLPPHAMPPPGGSGFAMPPPGGPSGEMPISPNAPTGSPALMMKKGGKAKAKAPVKKMASGGKVSSASSRGDGCATKGKTKGRMISMCGGGMYKKGK